MVYTFTQSHGTVKCFSHLGKFFKPVMAEIRLLHSFCCTTGDLTVLCHWQNNNSPLCKVSTICWVYLKLPLTWLQQLYTVWGCITVLKDHTSWQMYVPLPANSLMQSERHVTANVHIPVYITNCLESLNACSHSYLHLNISHYALFPYQVSFQPPSLVTV